MNLEELKLHLSGPDIHKLAGLNVDTDFPDVELTTTEWLGLRILCDSLALLDEEVRGLREQYLDDKEVKYILEVFEIETPWYTLVHKLNVGAYLGYSSTMYGLQKALKAADQLLQELIYET